jgi:hypothetical protein
MALSTVKLVNIKIDVLEFFQGYGYLGPEFNSVYKTFFERKKCCSNGMVREVVPRQEILVNHSFTRIIA